MGNDTVIPAYSPHASFPYFLCAFASFAFLTDQGGARVRRAG